MAKSKKETSASEDPVALGQAFLQQFEDAGLGPMRWMGTAWFEAMADMNSEVVNFVSERIKEDVKTQHELLHCKSAEELQKAQLAFLEKAYQQYTDETGKLVKMSLDMLPTAKAGTKGTPI
ncbi:phasin family protein [Yoonia sp. F2084L]|uniref:phasin family protein n=1 Tax=Yoonia sp. F2084L TaxID=2926419 RepID=UPI001FF29D71|nr:phasin family protein [Yoonia sp. F2084L]MCK0097363.1 phasin family protein [Yoonia sp. F2084L]